jgi:hypothetical protein
MDYCSKPLPIAGRLPAGTLPRAAPGAELELLLSQPGSLRTHEEHPAMRV